jgi:hypothetical protein
LLFAGKFDAPNGVDGRDKPGHDGFAPIAGSAYFTVASTK